MRVETPNKSPLATRIYFWVLAAHLLLAFVLLPAAMLAQQSGNTPVIGKAVQWQSAAAIEGTVDTGINYVSNVIGPLTSGGFVLHAVFQDQHGHGALKSVIAGIGVLGALSSGILRMHLEAPKEATFNPSSDVRKSRKSDKVVSFQNYVGAYWRTAHKSGRLAEAELNELLIRLGEELETMPFRLNEALEEKGALWALIKEYNSKYSKRSIQTFPQLFAVITEVNKYKVRDSLEKQLRRKVVTTLSRFGTLKP